MKSAFLLEKKHFEVEEVNFFNLKIYSKNVILEYTDTDNDYFRRSLFEMVRMRFNIGIYEYYEYR